MPLHATRVSNSACCGASNDNCREGEFHSTRSGISAPSQLASVASYVARPPNLLHLHASMPASQPLFMISRSGTCESVCCCTWSALCERVASLRAGVARQPRRLNRRCPRQH
eukprot:4862761-Pleurochrysis_carterae.AAC.3